MDVSVATDLARARSAVGRAQKQLRRTTQTLAQAADGAGVLEQHTVTDVAGVAAVASALTEAVRKHGRIHVVVIDDTPKPR